MDDNDNKQDGSQYLHPQILHNLAKSEIEGGAWLKDMVDGDYLMETQNTFYTITKANGKYTIMGHPRFCPTPREINIHGSTFGGSMLKIGFIGRGMHLEGSFPDAPSTGYFLTSEIKDITKL